ncbi:hypothetical protein CLAIMM_02997 [Cladophialophora immunda]|nr:hypothetical protein CLAIMM_02997 [Cladophialophora immunda]
MPHLRDPARLWAALVNRKDHAFLVLEILGRLWPRSLQDPPLVDEAYIKDIILLKTIFDVQRTRIRFNPPNRFILSPDDFLSCLNCLSQAAAPLRRSGEVGNTPTRGFVDIFQQVFFSGIRATALAIERQNDRMSARQRMASQLENCIRQWPLRDLRGPGRDWSLAIFKGVVDDLIEIKNSNSSCVEHIALDVPDRENFALTFDLSKSVPEAVACISRRCRYAYRSVLVLLDLRLMLISACFQYASSDSSSMFSINASESTLGNPGPTFTTDELTGVLQKWRALGSFFEPFQHTDEGRSLSTFLNYIEPGLPFGEGDENIGWMSTAIGMRASSANTSTQLPPYQRIAEDLERRNLKVFDTEGPLLRVYNHLSEQIRTWTPPRADVARSHSLESPDVTSQQAIYVLGCSKLHPIDFAMLADCIVCSGREVPEDGQDVVDVCFDCPFPHPEKTTVRKARRVTPLCEIYETLHKLVSLNPESEELILEREDAHLENEQLLESPTGSREALSSDQGSVNTCPQPPTPRTPSMNSLRQSSRTLGFFADIASSLKPSSKLKPTIHKHNKSESPPSLPPLQSALSPDGSNLIVWSSNRICRSPLNGGSSRLEGEKFLHDIILAATGASHFATVTQEEPNKSFQLSLFSATGKLAGEMPFGKPPQSLAFSYDGTKLAVAAMTELRIISTATPSMRSYCSQSLVPNTKSNLHIMQKADSAFWGKVRQQRVSFSTDQRRVLVGTQYRDDEGSTLFWLFNIPQHLNGNLSHRIRFEKKIKVESSEPGLTALPCFHTTGQTTFIIGAASAHSHQPSVESIERTQAGPQQIIGRNLSIDRVHRAIAMPGGSPCFIIVNEETNVYLIRKSSRPNEWEAEHVSTSISEGLSPFERNSNRPGIGVQIAASSAGEVVIFHIKNDKGYLTRYCAWSPPQTHQQTIPLNDLYPVAMDPGHPATLPNS